MKPFTPRISTRTGLVPFTPDAPRPNFMRGTMFISLASCSPLAHRPSVLWPCTISTAPLPQATVSGLVESTSPGWPVPLASAVFHTNILRAPAKVKAPGQGWVTARTRLCTVSAGLVQSMAPSSAVRRPFTVAFDSSCGVRGALPAFTSGSASSSSASLSRAIW